MQKQSITIEQGGLLRLHHSEVPVIKDILSQRGMSWACLDEQQGIVQFPQQYVGYIGLPDRKIIIKPKHPGVTISHILRVFFFLYTASNSDLDEPMYDIEAGDDVNIIDMFLREMLSIVHRGLPVEYLEKIEDGKYIKGNMLVVPTALNILLMRGEPFRYAYDDLTRDVPINRVLLAALRKLEARKQHSDITYCMRQLENVDYTLIPDRIIFNRNTEYCRKAVSLAFMILNDMTISSEGDLMSGESLLINFDKVFEEFIRKILMEYSNLGKFSCWIEPQGFASFYNRDGRIQKSYMPDLLYDCEEKDGVRTARAILDVKNKISSPFQNDDIYQMSFYGQLLSCRKAILCYPSNEDRENIALSFNDERLFLTNVYGAYMNLAGNSAKEFRKNIASFVYRVECLL